MGLRSPVLAPFGDDFAWSLFDAAPDGILVVSDTGEIVFANEHAGTMFAVPLDELVGIAVDDLVPTEARARHRAHRTRYRAHPEARAMGVGLELRAQRLDGTEFDAEISLSPLSLEGTPFVVAAVRDVGDRLAAQDHLRRVLHTLDASDDGIFLFDAATLVYSHVNSGAERLVGYRRDELTTMTPLHLNPYGTHAEYRALVDRLLADDTATERRETRLLRKDGSEVPVEKTYRAGPPARDGSRWIVVLARDITDRLEAQDALRARDAELQAAQQAVLLAEDHDRLARDLHDTVIQRLFAAGLSLQAVVAMAPDERIRTRLETTVADLDATIRELRNAIFALQAPAPGPSGVRGRILDVVTEASASLPFEPRIQFDGAVETIDERILEHLLPTLREALSNVAKHARASSVRVSVSVGDDVVLEVLDDGVGVPDEVFGGQGIPNLVRRAEKLGGTAAIGAAPTGAGCRLAWRVPASST
ncbi:PAS domain S-box protein [Aquihabitans daechungensis]|uniref:PAS domain-containing sensor histidine kinase n=1 Tax=Aquihabitans daechungensis TaxID=1052257 RepID=UPI003BA11FB8